MADLKMAEATTKPAGAQVLSVQDRVFRRNPLDQCGDLVDVFMAHAGHRLIEQHHLGIERQRRCYFKGALAAIGHLYRRRVGELAQSDVVQKFTGAIVEAIKHAL